MSTTTTRTTNRSQVSEANADKPLTERQAAALEHFGYPTEDVTRARASEILRGIKDADPDRWAQYQAEQRAQREAQPAQEKETPVLDAYVAASLARYGAQSREATPEQIRVVMRIAHRLPEGSSERINAFSTLKGGVSKRQASFLIGTLGK